MGGNCISQTLIDVRHLGLGEVQLTEGERVVDAESSHSLNQSGRTTAVVGESRDFSDIAAITDFHEVERDDVANREVLEEQGRMDTELTEIAVEHVDGRGVGAGGSVTVEVADGFRGRHVIARNLLRGEHEVRERTLHQRTRKAVIRLILAGLLVDGGEDVLEGRLGEVSEVARDERGRGSVIRIERKTELGRRGGDGFGGVSVGGLDEPLIKTTGLVGNQSTVDGLFGLGGVGGAHRLFHVTLEHGHGLGDVVLEFILNAGDVGHAGLGEFRDSRGASENLDEVAKFGTILLGVATRSIADVVIVVGLRNISSVDDTIGLGVGKGVNLPAEEGLLGLRTLACHRGEGGILRIDERDEVGDFFSAAKFVGLGEVAFEQLRHGSRGLGYRNLDTAFLRSSRLWVLPYRASMFLAEASTLPATVGEEEGFTDIWGTAFAG